MRASTLSLVLVLLASPALARDAVALLRRGDRAERMSCYTGTKQIWACGSSRTREHPDYQRSVRIWHDGPGRTRLEFLRPEGGPARVVIENGSHRWFYSPRHKQWRPVSWREPAPRLDLLLKNYRVIPGPVETVAGRRALQVRVEPRYPGNPHKLSWLDLATGITLRTDLYDSSGGLVSRSEFLQFTQEHSLPVSLFSVPVALTQESRQAHGENPHGEWAAGQSANVRLSFEPALPRHLPRGYVLDRLIRTRTDGTEMIRALYTDGLNTVSLVQWRGPREPADRGRERFWGPGDRIRWNIGMINATLSGDVAPAELRRIAGSVRVPRGSSLVTRK